MSNKVQLDLDVLLPNIPDEKDRCVHRLMEVAQNSKGIEEVHVDYKNGKAVVCIHYDTEYLTLSQVERIMQQTGAQLTERYQHDTLHITDMDCADCATSIEHIIGRMDGIVDVSVNYAAEKLRVEYDSQKLSTEDIRRIIQQLGYKIEEPERPKAWYQRHTELLLSLLSGLFLAIGFVIEKTLQPAVPMHIGLYLLAYLTGGYHATMHGIKAALRFKFDVDFLMVAAAAGAAVLGEWSEGAFLLFLFSLGHALEHAAMDKARNAIRALGQLTPKTARVKQNSTETELPVEKLQRGDVVILRPGERVPIDGRVILGQSELDESSITGESVPKFKQVGDEVFAGSVNSTGVLEIEVTKLAKDTTLSRIIKLIEEAQTQKSPSQRRVQKITGVLVPAILLSVLAVIFIPPVLQWLAWKEAFLRAMAMLVAASPCALAIATPSAILAAIARSARKGVLVKGGVHLENFGALRAIAFDKTGTLTHGKPEVTDIVPMDSVHEDGLLSLAASLESRSEHPLARAILLKAQERNLALREVAQVDIVPGKGIYGVIDRNPVHIGGMRFFQQDDGLSDKLLEKARKLEDEGKTVIFIKQNERFLGMLALSDQPRAEAPRIIAELHRMGIQKTVMLTGDNRRVAQNLAQKLGLSEFHADLMPEDKVRLVKQLCDTYKYVAMVGDGVNDAPALATATVGVAMGAAGTDVAIETADVALMSDALDKIPFTVGLSRKMRRIIMQNMFIAFGVIALLVPLSLAGVASIGGAILLHEGSTLVVVVNALRLLNYRM
ncbi:MAG: heavy metal translocating P-type ATPase [candidate division KSB1 bacterium]|nr:heavy metal translocating P-type ATPase [candidate division KSB1 bacterium]